MICVPCTKQQHVKCDNPKTCTCQHKETEVLNDGTIAPRGVRRDVR
jgi:hypothetical protein